MTPDATSPAKEPDSARCTPAIAGILLALIPLVFACATASTSTSPSPSPSPSAAPAPAAPAQRDEPSDSLRDYAVRRSLRDARIYRDQGRLEAALRATERGLAAAPDEARLHRLHADLLAELGREEEAAQHRARADALAPPPPPLPATPLEAASAGELLVLLLPPPADDDPRFPRRAERIPREWPDASVAGTLRERLALRLPEAEVVLLERSQLEHELGSVDAVRGFFAAHGRANVLSIRVDRAFCGSSVEQGEWAVAWLRLASGTRGQGSTRVLSLRRVIERPASCKSEVLARALENAFAQPSVQNLLDRAHAGGDWSRRTIRRLFPDLGLFIGREMDAGRRQLAGGNLVEAEEHFRRAVAIDPGELDASTFLQEVQLVLALSRELSRPAAGVAQAGSGADELAGQPGSSPAGEHLRPGLREEEIRSLRRRLREESARRNELLAALAVMDDSTHAPSDATLAVLRPSEIRDPDALGPRLARSQAGSEVEARVLFAPDGAVVARYYFETAGGDLVLREEDADGDDRPDLWTAYSGGARRELWQDDFGLGTPNLHVAFAEGGISVEQVEIDANGDGRMERRFFYEEGRLSAEQRDTTGDGQLDRWERFHGDGSLAMREEDLDGDSEPDIRTIYRSGRMVSQEILNPAAVGSLDRES